MLSSILRSEQRFDDAYVMARVEGQLNDTASP
jgi:hypothetical protein